MKKMMKKLCVCMMVALLGLMPGSVTETKALTYEWSGEGGWTSYYETPDDARNYNMKMM